MRPDTDRRVARFFGTFAAELGKALEEEALLWTWLGPDASAPEAKQAFQLVLEASSG